MSESNTPLSNPSLRQGNPRNGQDDNYCDPIQDSFIFDPVSKHVEYHLHQLLSMPLAYCLNRFHVEFNNELFNLDLQDSVDVKSLDLISFYDWQDYLRQEDDDDAPPSLGSVCKDFQNEIEAYKRIWRHNHDHCSSPDEQINVPKFLFSGDAAGLNKVIMDTRN
ncbi:unnamed protein product [Ambrosiozyma monospora]|uniref:Unnamed protein product n=1 Tax=Ambrosiozyma monospora TaxID=43982 RepID=A0ACB5TTD8_AMBMO|nr:unnamed protein product [Ambrosiozyma monospora]